MDDGLTDSSSILYDKIQQDIGKSVAVIHQRNSGLSTARSIALEVTNEAYVDFGDPDDRIARTKPFRRKSLEDNQFRFQKDHRNSEDLEFVMDCLIAANTFAT